MHLDDVWAVVVVDAVELDVEVVLAVELVLVWELVVDTVVEEEEDVVLTVVD